MFYTYIKYKRENSKYWEEKDINELGKLSQKYLLEVKLK